jgi:hypothetical protein
MRGKLVWISIIIAITPVLAGGSDRTSTKKDKSTLADQSINFSSEWQMLDLVAGNPTRSVLHSSSIRDAGRCKISDLRRYFHIDKTEFVLGEPIIVEFRIELHGPGQWRESMVSMSRSDGRDGSFLFLMRHEDGTWVRDPHGPVRAYHGGWGRLIKAKKGKPGSKRVSLEDWCVIDRPGIYDLFCLKASEPISNTREPSPILNIIPAMVEEPIYWPFLRHTTDYANFRIVVHSPSKDKSYEQKPQN